MSNQIIKNKKAFHNYEVLDRFEAGISLVGTEVKSLREGSVKIMEAFCRISKDYELTLNQLEISHFKQGNINNHEVTRVRKLLMHKREIFRLSQKMQEKGLSLIPTAMYFKRGRVKVEIALCRGKKMHDKRASLKEKDQKREIARALKG
ncbi:MAG: SsrA-binding protein SmpB [SAR324 cluster bacterium]|nr:SsrA-binding protein SmpB [SAR324 cluster bacterium]